MPAVRHNLVRARRAYVKAYHLWYLGFFLLMLISVAMLMLPHPYCWLSFALVGTIVWVVGSLKHPFAGLFLYLIVFFGNPNQHLAVLAGMPIPYEKIIAFVIIATLLIHIAVIKKKFDIYRLDYALLAFLGAAFVSILGATDYQSAWDEFNRFFRVVVVYLLITRIVTSPHKLKAVVSLYIVSVAFLAISSSYLYYTGDFEVAQGVKRAHSLGDSPIDPNTLATSLIVGIPFMYYMAKAHKSILLKVFMLLLLVSCIWTVILTGSRGGMVGAVAVVCLLAWHSRYRLTAFAVALAVLAIFAAAMPGQYQERFLTIFAVGQEDQFGAGDSAYGRINGLILGFKFLLKNPVTGVGIGNFGWHHHLVAGGDWTSAHNLVGKLVGELGLLGVATFVFFIVRFAQAIKYVKMKYRECRWRPDFVFYTAEAVKIGLIMLFVQGLFGHNLFRDNWYIFAGYIVVASNLVSQRNKIEQQARQTALPVPASETR